MVIGTFDSVNPRDESGDDQSAAMTSQGRVVD